MRKLAIGAATFGLMAGTLVVAPTAEADPEACATAWPLTCSYQAHHVGGCYYVGHVKIFVGGTLVADVSSATLSQEGCAGVGPGTITVVPQSPGSAAAVGSRGQE